MPEATTEILVIGGGVIGSAIAYHLARAGHATLVLDQHAPAAPPAASWASAGGVRRQGRDAAEALLARRALERWPALEHELGADLHYRQNGQLLVAENDAEATELIAFVAQQHALGFGDVRLASRAELRELVPGLAPQVVAGSYSPADGQADPVRTTHAFAAAAQQLGARYWTETRCLALRTVGCKVVGAQTTRGEIAAGRVVLAAGAWSDELASAIGLTLPIRTAVYQMLRSTPAPASLLGPVVSALGRPLSLKQLPDGAFLLGGGWPGDATPDRRGYTLREASIEGSWAAACAILPAVGAQRVAAAWCGLEAESADGVPFVGPAPGWEQLTLAVGFSGHGFALAPAVGQAIADQLVGGDPPELAPLDPARMAGWDAAVVAQFQASETNRQPYAAGPL
jgi:sarcosine oxidase subunit beta